MAVYCSQAVMAVGWPARISIAGGWRKRRGESEHEVWTGAFPIPAQSLVLRVGQRCLVVRVPAGMASAAFRICPFADFAFGFPPAARARLFHGLSALTSLLLEISKNILEGGGVQSELGL